MKEARWTRAVFVGLELAAQAAAALHVLEASEGGAPASRPGYLVDVREAHYAVAWIPADCELRARMHRTGWAGPLSAYDVLVEVAGAPCVKGVMSTNAR